MNIQKMNIKKRLFTALCAVGLWLMPQAWATDLPPGVVNYLRQKDPNVEVRFDGLVIFSNGESYVPVIPQDPALNPNPQQVIATMPETDPYPDFIQFDNHFFLMRLIQTASGRLTFPKLDEYPIQLKEGLLPQDFVLPNNLFIPVELKVILGALPYNPTYVPPENPVIVPAAVVLSNTQASSHNARQRLTYVFNLNEQRLQQIDPLSGRKQADLAIDCVPSTLRLSPDGKLLFAACLSTNELVAIDTSANLVKTRIPVGQRPDTLLFVDNAQQVVISHRYSPYLSLISTTELLPGEKITLPGNSGAMAPVPGEPDWLVVADAFKPQAYLLNLSQRTLQKELPVLSDVSAMRVLPGPDGRLELWAASRTGHQVAVYDLASGTHLKTFDVGRKPVDLAVNASKLYVLSAGSARLDVIDWVDKVAREPITFQQDSFPSGMTVLASEKRAYITTAGVNQLITVDLENERMEHTRSVPFRANLITMTPDPEETLSRPVSQKQLEALPVPQAQPAATEPSPQTGWFKFKKTAKPQAQPAREPKAGAAPLNTSPSDGPAARPTFTPSTAGGSEALPTQGGGRFYFKLGKDKAPDEEQDVAEPEASPDAGDEPAMPAVPAELPDMLDSAE